MKHPFSMFEVADLLHRYPARQMVDHTHKFAQGTGEELRGHTIKAEFALALLEPAVRDGERLFEEYAEDIAKEKAMCKERSDERNRAKEEKRKVRQLDRDKLQKELDELEKSSFFHRYLNRNRIWSLRGTLLHWTSRFEDDHLDYIFKDHLFYGGAIANSARRKIDRWRFLLDLASVSLETIQVSAEDAEILIDLKRHGTQTMREAFAKHFKEQDHG